MGGHLCHCQRDPAPAAREQTGLGRGGWKFGFKRAAESVALCFGPLMGPLCSLLLDCPQCSVLKVKTRLLFNVFPDIRVIQEKYKELTEVVGYKMEMNIFLYEGVDCIYFYCV